ncbi:MAG: S9 family peptidase [Bacteroidota bacterium]
MIKFYATLLIILLFSGLIFSQEKKDISLEDVWVVYSFYPQSIDGLKSMEEGEYYAQINLNRDIDKYSYKTGKKVETIFSLNDISQEKKPKNISDYFLSADETKILLSTDNEQIYRHSFKASYYVWDMKLKKLTYLSENGKQMLADFSPDGNKIAYVRDNNLFYYNLTTAKEIQITTDGKVNEIINGAPDWVYEEEFSFSKAYEWSPDSKYIAYIRFDETNVKEFNMTTYGSLYPEWYKYKYPKAGEENSKVSVHIYNISANKSIDVDLGLETDIYIPRILWTKSSENLSFQKMNRLQNKWEIFIANSTNGSVKKLYQEINKCYIEITDNLTFLSDGQSFIITSEKDGYNHIYLYNFEGKEIKQITSGNWDVTKFLGYDSKLNLYYYLSTETSPVERLLYSVSGDGIKKTRLTSESGVHDIEFSKGFKYYVDYFSDSNTPTIISLYNSSGKLIRKLEDNQVLIDKMKDYKFTKKELFTFKTSENVELYGWMIKPFNFDENKKYPVFMTVYGGPGRQTVMNEWDYTQLWYQHIANKGYIIVSVDNRGTDGRGAEFKRASYGQMGKLETIDQIEAAKYLAELQFVDGNRIGIQGWSYGGYMATLCMTKGADVFKAGIAIAPVTNWRYYDSIYTERYMGMPQDNADGYDENSPINFVNKLKGPYMLAHGTADDNVHFQNTVELVDALVQADKHFNLMFYPNSNHGIYTGRNTRYHLFSQMTNFIIENL